MRAPYYTKGLPKRLIDYFADNPDEELTLDMVIIKFDARPDGAQKAILRLVEAGVLESVRVIRLPAKGRASPSIEQIQAARAMLDANPVPTDGRMIAPGSPKANSGVESVSLHAYDMGEE